MPQISLCMIVKDEAECLPRFLDAAAGAWDELIAIDSESTDTTRALIEAAGGTVTTRPWTDDFAAARNAALDQATGEWILVLDADEFIDPEAIASLRKIASDSRAGAGRLTLRNPMPGGHSRTNRLLRFFRNRGTNRYTYAIHEDISEPVTQMLRTEGLQLRSIGGEVEHIGYLREHAAGKNKQARDTALLQRCIDADPRDLYSRSKLLEVAQFWRDAAATRTAAAQLNSEIARTPTSQIIRHHWAARMLERLGRALHECNPLAERAYLERWLQSLPHAPELLFRLGLVCEALEDLDAAEAQLLRCLELRSDNPQLVTVRPRVGLARIAMARGDWPTGIHHAEAALSNTPLDVEALVAWWVCALQAQVPHATDALIEHTVSRCGPSRSTYSALAAAAQTLGLSELAHSLAHS